ncbi:MAG: NUDIX domain-containing protein [Planctomycetota bacterium]
MKTDFSCGVVPVRLDQGGGMEFLLVQLHAGHWAFPKGHPEKGEDDRTAAERELLEETGLVAERIVEGVSFDEGYVFTKKSGKQVSKTVRYFLGLIAGEAEVVVQPEEVKAFAWGDAAATRERFTFDEGKALFDRVTAWLAANGRASVFSRKKTRKNAEH